MKGPWRKLLEYASLFQNIKHKCLTQIEKLSSLGNIMASQEKEAALNFQSWWFLVLSLLHIDIFNHILKKPSRWFFHKKRCNWHRFRSTESPRWPIATSWRLSSSVVPHLFTSSPHELLCQNLVTSIMAL